MFWVFNVLFGANSFPYDTLFVSCISTSLESPIETDSVFRLLRKGTNCRFPLHGTFDAEFKFLMSPQDTNSVMRYDDEMQPSNT